MVFAGLKGDSPQTGAPFGEEQRSMAICTHFAIEQVAGSTLVHWRSLGWAEGQMRQTSGGSSEDCEVYATMTGEPLSAG